MNSPTPDALLCDHCGDHVKGTGVTADDRVFCCSGCRAVYQILHPSDSCPVVDPSRLGDARFAYLDEPSLANRLLTFSDGTVNATTFFVPQMHCSSCVWLLENLYRLDPGILSSRVDFLKKRIAIQFAAETTTLRKVVELLAALGYEPRISMDSAAGSEQRSSDNSLYYRVGIAGFCFANIMILSFPEYLSGGAVDGSLQMMFSWLTVALSVPVLFYCSIPFFTLAVGGLRMRTLTIEVPIAAGILVIAVRSVVDIAAETGSGYFDSLSGLVFFLLLGRLFQAKTFDALNFERTFEAYFPLAVTVRNAGGERSVAVADIRPGDRMVIRNSEIVPADAVLMQGDAEIDYSFVTGEARPVPCDVGALIRAGGRQIGSAIELEAVAEVSRSYLTQLWNGTPDAKRPQKDLASLSNAVSRVFTYAVIAVALGALLYWLPTDTGRALDAVTSVLIVACPCALALSTPFAFGTAQRVLGRAKMYLKDIGAIERLANATAVVLDKTGTLTRSRSAVVRFVGMPLSDQECADVASLAYNSPHPLSRSIYAVLPPRSTMSVSGFIEYPNQGVEGVVEGKALRLGSRKFAWGMEEKPADEETLETRVYLSIGQSHRGYFAVAGEYREGVGDLIHRLQKTYDVAVLTGDNDWERQSLESRLGPGIPVHFGQSPGAKREFVESLQRAGKSVLMAGDGLNDAVALRAADVGVALTEDAATFTPASDAILEGSTLTKLDRFLAFARTSKNVVVWSYGISFLYNIVGLSFAVRGALSPIVAAILMPLSSMTVVAFATIAVRVAGKKAGVDS
jgi:P-type Cu+ transporter